MGLAEKHISFGEGGTGPAAPKGEDENTSRGRDFAMGPRESLAITILYISGMAVGPRGPRAAGQRATGAWWSR